MSIDFIKLFIFWGEKSQFSCSLHYSLIHKDLLFLEYYGEETYHFFSLKKDNNKKDILQVTYVIVKLKYI